MGQELPSPITGGGCEVAGDVLFVLGAINERDSVVGQKSLVQLFNLATEEWEQNEGQDFAVGWCVFALFASVTTAASRVKQAVGTVLDLRGIWQSFEQPASFIGFFRPATMCCGTTVGRFML